MNFHIHKYKFECLYANGHCHRLFGYAGKMLGIDGFHIHIYYGVSSYDSHTHYFYGVTGMPIRTENGHMHKMDGLLEINNMHEHKYKGYTGEDISYFTSSQAVNYVR